MLKLWEWRSSNQTDKPFLNQELANLNHEFHWLSWLPPCSLKSKYDLPTNFSFDSIEISRSCVVEVSICLILFCDKVKTIHFFKGNGTKNIVIVGNSHSIVSFYGIEKQFKDVYRQLTLVAVEGCIFGRNVVSYFLLIGNNLSKKLYF